MVRLCCLHLIVARLYLGPTLHGREGVGEELVGAHSGLVAERHGHEHQFIDVQGACDVDERVADVIDPADSRRPWLSPNVGILRASNTSSIFARCGLNEHRRRGGRRIE